MFGANKKNKSAVSKSGNGAVDFSKVKTGDVSNDPTNKIVANSVLQSGNISSMGLTKEDQAALVAKRNEIPFTTKVLKYGSTALFSAMLASLLFLTADLDPNNSYFSIFGLSDNTGSTYTKVSQENTQKKQESSKLADEVAQLQNRMENQIFGNFTDVTESIAAEQRTWFTEVKPVTRVDEITDEEVTEDEVIFGLIDMVDYLIAYFEDRSFKTTFFKAKEEGLVTASQSRGRISSSEALLMSNELELKSLAINDNTANISFEASDIYGKVFTLAGEIVDITNSTPIYKGGFVRTFQRQSLDSGDSGVGVSLRLDLQKPDEEDPADGNFKYLRDWLETERIIPTN